LDKPNFFDDLTTNIDQGEAAQLAGMQEKEHDRLDFLIHAVFSQNKKGAELLEKWKESLIMVSTAEPNMDLIEVGIREGQKRFIKSILLTVKRVGES